MATLKSRKPASSRIRERERERKRKRKRESTSCNTVILFTHTPEPAAAAETYFVHNEASKPPARAVNTHSTIPHGGKVKIIARKLTNLSPI